MTINKPDWCSENMNIQSWLKLWHVWEDYAHVIELVTETGAAYRTSQADERIFQSLVKQVPNDQLIELRFSDLNVLQRLQNSEEVWTWIKQRLEKALTK